MISAKTPGLLLISILAGMVVHAQTITGVWKGKINRQHVEVKIIQKGDSLTGTSYYFENNGNFRRYSIRGYFDAYTNAVTWWDDNLIESGGSAPGRPQLSVADFNCPGGGRMLLEGSASDQQKPGKKDGPVDLVKTGNTAFPDEWDFVIDHYLVGGNHPDIIDSVALVAGRPKPTEPVFVNTDPAPLPQLPPARKGMVVIPPMPAEKEPAVVARDPETIEQKFQKRKNELTKEIPVSGDSIELVFYDNAEIDGDSISLFLNSKMIFTHIRLGSQPYIIKIALTDLQDENDLVMVAENLGSIPPNTAYMLAIVGEQRYSTYLSSTEEVSALIRLKKE